MSEWINERLREMSEGIGEGPQKQKAFPKTIEDLHGAVSALEKTVHMLIEQLSSIRAICAHVADPEASEPPQGPRSGLSDEVQKAINRLSELRTLVDSARDELEI